jgi:hypothetical protein
MSGVDELAERISRFVQDNPGCTVAHIEAAVPAIKGVVPVLLRKLERAGFIERSGGRYRSFKSYPLELAGTHAAFAGTAA